MKKVTMFAAIAAAIATLGAASVFAHGGATGIVKERMDLMKVMGQSLKQVSAMMRGKAEYDADQVRALAAIIGKHGGKNMTATFPHGSNMPPSEALPSIWSDWEKFSLLADNITDYAKALEQAAENERHSNKGGMMSGSSNMMQGGQKMLGGSGGMMMKKDNSGPSIEQLTKMPPDAAFMQLTKTCSQCHQDFRQEKG